MLKGALLMHKLVQQASGCHAEASVPGLRSSRIEGSRGGRVFMGGGGHNRCTKTVLGTWAQMCPLGYRNVARGNAGKF